jgi:antitoxin component of MazEF toxin-antitoxin module
MVVTLRKSGDTFSFTLPPKAVEDLSLVDGSAIDVQRVDEACRSDVRFASVEQALEAYEQTRMENDEAYRELAK